MTERLRAVVLAAGAGERMGGPKALLVMDGGEALASLHVRRFRDAGCEDALLVTRPELVARFEGAGLRALASSAPDPAGSLAVGLRALTLSPDPDPADLLFITPVDALPASLATLSLLLDALRSAPHADAATPRFGARGGHPVLLRARLLAGFADAPRPLRDLLAPLGEARLRVSVDDPAIALDLDTPADVLAATGAPPRFS